MKTVAFSFGRLNPPTRGHQLLIETVSEQEGEPRLYLSHTCDKKKNPLTYEKKLYWCDKSFGHLVNVVESEARNMYDVMKDLYEEGFTDVIYVCGSDRAGEADRMRAYNGNPEENSKAIYNFNSITVVQAGNERLEEDDIPVEKVSASMQRKFVIEGDLDSFISGCPEALSDEECEELFEDVKAGLGLTINEAFLTESPNVVGDATFDYTEDGKEHTKSYQVKSNHDVIMGDDRKYSKWADRDIDSIEFEDKVYDDVTVQPYAATSSTTKTKFKAKGLILNAVQGLVSKGFESEDKAVAEGELRNKIVEAIKSDLYSKDKSITDIILVECNALHHNPSRNITYKELFTVKNLFKPYDIKQGEIIADTYYTFAITRGKSESVETFYVSNKYGAVHSPINAGINKLSFEELFEPILDLNRLTKDEINILKLWRKTFSSSNIVGAVSGKFTIAPWYHIIDNGIKIDNVKNFIINQYSSGYYYVVEDTKGNVTVEDIEDKLSKYRASNITDCYVTITHSMLAINASIAGENYEIDMRRKGQTNYSLLSKLNSSPQVKRQGTELYDLSNYGFKLVAKSNK